MLKPPEKPYVTSSERKRRKSYRSDMYEKCLARFLIARQMIRLGEVRQASDYLNSLDNTMKDYTQHLRSREYAYDPRALKYLVRYVLLEIDILKSKPGNGERRETDRRFYLKKISDYGW